MFLIFPIISYQIKPGARSWSLGDGFNEGLHTDKGCLYNLSEEKMKWNGKGSADESWPISLLGVLKCQKSSLESPSQTKFCGKSPEKIIKLEVFIHYFYIKFTM